MPDAQRRIIARAVIGLGEGSQGGVIINTKNMIKYFGVVIDAKGAGDCCVYALNACVQR